MYAAVKGVNLLNRPGPTELQSGFLNSVGTLAECFYKHDLILPHLKGEHIRAEDQQQQRKDDYVNNFFHSVIYRLFVSAGGWHFHIQHAAPDGFLQINIC